MLTKPLISGFSRSQNVNLERQREKQVICIPEIHCISGIFKLHLPKRSACVNGDKRFYERKQTITNVPKTALAFFDNRCIEYYSAPSVLEVHTGGNSHAL